MKVFNNFAQYEHENPVSPGVIYIRCGSGECWYDYVKADAESEIKTLKVVFDTAAGNVIRDFNVSARSLWPVNYSVAEVALDDVPAGVARLSYAYINGVIREMPLVIAKRKLSALLRDAGKAITPLQDAVDIDDATLTETALLKEWKRYRVKLNRLDLATVQEGDWPAPPLT